MSSLFHDIPVDNVKNCCNSFAENSVLMQLLITKSFH